MEKENESPGIYRHQDCVESQYDQVPCQKKISNKAVVLESFWQNCISSCLNQLKATMNGEIPSYINYLNFPNEIQV